jgi:short-subunit dehydrogenase
VELEGTGVTVTTLCPGPTRTGFQVVAGTGDTPLFQGLGVMDVGPVAEAGHRATVRGQALVVPGVLNKLVALSTRLGSRLQAARIAGWRQKRRG